MVGAIDATPVSRPVRRSKLARLELPNMSNGVSLYGLRGRVRRGPCRGCVVVVIQLSGTIIARVWRAEPE